MKSEKIGNLKKILPLLALYFSANALFVYKYGARTRSGSGLALLLYTGFLATAFPVYLKFFAPKIENMKPARFAAAYWGLLGFFAVAALVLLFKIDPYSVDVDR